MISGFIVKKSQMGQKYTSKGKKIAVTTLVAAPIKVTQVKTVENDGYVAVQVAYGKRKRLDKPTADKLKKIKLEITPKGFIEFAPLAESTIEVGQEIAIDQVFQVGDTVDAIGTSKGRGFAGVIKRWGFQRQPVTGGQSDRVRAPGSIGAQTPGKVLKGKKMPGHYGNKQITVSNLTVIEVNKDQNEIVLSGSVPGAFNSWVMINKRSK